MRRLLKILFSFAGAVLVSSLVVVAQQQATLTANTTNYCILPQRGVVNVPEWTLGGLGGVGTLCSSNGNVYLQMTEGTNSACPTQLKGISTNGGVVHLKVDGLLNYRKGLAVSFVSGVATVFVNFGSAAIPNWGYALKPGDPPLVIQSPAPQEAVHVISSANGAVVSALEW